MSSVPGQPKLIYLVGSLRNPDIPHTANRLREAGFEVFDDWYSSGPETDEKWQEYEQIRGRTFVEALKGWHAQNQYRLDLTHLKRADIVVLVAPAGKSGHLELGWALGFDAALEMLEVEWGRKRGYILLDRETDRFDIMYNFAHGVFYTLEELVKELTNTDDYYHYSPTPLIGSDSCGLMS